MSKRMEAKKLTRIESSDLGEILNNLRENGLKTFDESVDLELFLGINPKKSDENVRGNLSLVHGIKRNIKVCVITNSHNESIAKEMGVTVVGGENLIEEIKSTKVLNYDILICTQDMFQKIVPIAQLLSKNKLMPNAKDGTLVTDLKAALENLYSGKKLNFRNDSNGYLRLSIGKLSFSNESIQENINLVIKHIQSLKPAKVKQMVKRCRISTTMGLSYLVPIKSLLKF